MSNTIYRKYRPQLFADVICQDSVVQTLQNEIVSDTIAHAYLFSGPRGLGKTTTARLLAKAINCVNRDKKSPEPCNKCEACVNISHGQSLDFIEIDAASNRGINEIRALKEHVGFTPSGSKYRVFIIDEVHMLTTEAFNALLKTLEEPPAHAVFILATTEIHKVPDTIQSRCQTFIFKRASKESLKSRLSDLARQEGVEVDDAVLDIVVSRSGGFVRDAESLLGQVISIGKDKVDVDAVSSILPTSRSENVHNMLDMLTGRKTKEALTLITGLVDEGADLIHYARELLESVRKLMLVQHGIDGVDLALEENAKKISKRDAIRLARLISNAIEELKYSEIPQLPLELMVIEFIGDNVEGVDVSGSEPEPSTDTAVDDNTTRLHGEEKSDMESVGVDEKTETGLTKKTNQAKNNNDSDKKKTSKNGKLKTGIDVIRSKWFEVVSHGRNHNHALALALNMVHPISVDGNTLTVGGAYEFHCERLLNVENSKVVEKVLHEVFDEPIAIKVIRISEEEASKFMPEESNVSPEEEEKLVDDVLATFGGQVVG